MGGLCYRYEEILSIMENKKQTASENIRKSLTSAIHKLSSQKKQFNQ